MGIFLTLSNFFFSLKIIIFSLVKKLLIFYFILNYYNSIKNFDFIQFYWIFYQYLMYLKS